MNYGGDYSLADIAAATGNGRSGDGFGGENGSWWIIIFLIFALTGWGGRGNGFGGGSGSGAADNYVLASDFATLQRQLSDGVSSLERKGDAITNGLCDGFYAINTAFGNLNTNLANQFAATNSNLFNGFAGVNNAITTNGYETRIGLNGIGSQLASCCCDIREAISGVNYNMAINNNSILNAMCGNTRDIIESNNANYRALHDEIVANRIEDKNAQIQAQQNEINALRLAASQAKQTNEIVNQVHPCPIPAYVTCNPWNYQQTSCGCGCGSNL